MNKRIVMKFGGSSVSTVEKMKGLTKKILYKKNHGYEEIGRAHV